MTIQYFIKIMRLVGRMHADETKCIVIEHAKYDSSTMMACRSHGLHYTQKCIISFTFY